MEAGHGCVAVALSFHLPDQLGLHVTCRLALCCKTAGQQHSGGSGRVLGHTANRTQVHWLVDARFSGSRTRH